MKITVFGAGAVGGHLAVRLAQGGAAVSVIARGAQLAAIATSGLTVEASDGIFSAHPRASHDPRDLGPQDMVLVTVKAPALPSVAAVIAPLLGPETAVAFVMNGIPWWYFHGAGGAREGKRLPAIDPGDGMWRAVGPERAIGGVIYSACTVVRPGVIAVENRRSRLILGEPDGRLSRRAEALAALLRAEGMMVEVTPVIRDAIWSKLLLNLTSGPFSILTGLAPREIYTEPGCVAASARILAEGQAIATALGCQTHIDAEAQVRQYLAMSHKPSILQDLELGRAMEITALLETPLDLARLAGIATPTLDLLVALVKLRAQAAGLYGKAGYTSRHHSNRKIDSEFVSEDHNHQKLGNQP